MDYHHNRTESSQSQPVAATTTTTINETSSRRVVSGGTPLNPQAPVFRAGANNTEVETTDRFVPPIRPHQRRQQQADLLALANTSEVESEAETVAPSLANDHGPQTPVPGAAGLARMGGVPPGHPRTMSLASPLSPPSPPPRPHRRPIITRYYYNDQVAGDDTEARVPAPSRSYILGPPLFTLPGEILRVEHPATADPGAIAYSGLYGHLSRLEAYNPGYRYPASFPVVASALPPFRAPAQRQMTQIFSVPSSSGSGRTRPAEPAQEEPTEEEEQEEEEENNEDQSPEEDEEEEEEHDEEAQDEEEQEEKAASREAAIKEQELAAQRKKKIQLACFKRDFDSARSFEDDGEFFPGSRRGGPGLGRA
ncbi:hypothetical protein F5Y17DRAFT_455689 [Xylariaceae sp. FL0594]|nr:hypothetical protein F5Y17DRAFT_455689 [Xylariaceae sp. FL0594]